MLREQWPAVHTLLQVVDCIGWQWPEAMPLWAVDALQRAPWVVVRRAPPRGGFHAAGVRGAVRGERAAAWVPAASIAASASPQSLVARGVARGREAAAFAALAALPAAAEIFAAHDLDGAWGPGGSVGFELASGLPTATASSDLDLIVHIEEPGAIGDAARLHTDLAGLPVRTDVLLETPHGGVLLADYVGGARDILLRSNRGPRLVRSPWDLAIP